MEDLRRLVQIHSREDSQQNAKHAASLEHLVVQSVNVSIDAAYPSYIELKSSRSGTNPVIRPACIEKLRF